MKNTPHEPAAQIIKHYGAQKQLIQLMEECSELIQAASKCIRAGNDYSDDFVEEMADVKIMLMQFECILPEYYTQLLHDMTVYKLRRQVERMEGEEKGEDGNPPKPPTWEYEEPFTGERLQFALPMCPSCNEPLYELERCGFCGQEILLDPEADAELREYLKPPETGVMVCMVCGKETMEYTVNKYNGHRHGRCKNCGTAFME